MREKIVIVGAGGQGKVCGEIAELNGYKEIIFLDDSGSSKLNVVGTTNNLFKYTDDYDVFIALGNNVTRKEFIDKVVALNGKLATLIHPQSVVSKKAIIKEGSVVMAGAVVNSGAIVERGGIVNTCSSVDHDCHMLECSHIGVGAHLAGTVTIKERTLIGAGATIINNLSVCEDTIVGAGAVVIRNITVPGTYVGVPTRRIK